MKSTDECDMARLRLRSFHHGLVHGLTATGLLILGGVPAMAAAQSFDCAKASTSTERAICSSPELRRLDSDLAAAYRTRLASDPAHRRAAVAEERHWLVERDRRCSGTGDAAGDGGIQQCLAAAYRVRLGQLRDAGPDGSAPSRTAICKAIVGKYETLVASLAKADSGRRRAAKARDVLVALAQQPASGVTLGSRVIDDVDPRKLIAWGESQKPPLSVPPSFLERVKQNVPTSQELDHLPGTDFYAVNGTEGTASCYGGGVYFRAKEGRIESAAPPRDWSEPGCMTMRWFGAVDGTPAAFVTESNATAAHYTLTVNPWRGSGFGDSCTAVFHFEQRLLPEGTDSDADTSDSDDCEAFDPNRCTRLRHAVRQLIERVQEDPRSADRLRTAAIQKLSRAQALRYKALVAAVAAGDSQLLGGDWKPAETPDDGTKYRPYLMPLVVGGDVYLAQVGHALVRDVSMPDWRVGLRGWGDGGPDRADVLTYTVGVGTGRFAGATVR